MQRVCEKVYRAFGGGKRKRGRPRLKGEDNTKMNLQNMEWGGGIEWIGLVHDRDKWRLLCIQ
jgi:hypothetical protein